MKKLLAEIIPIVRMAVSGEVLKTVSFCPDDEIELAGFKALSYLKSIEVTRETLDDLLTPDNLRKIRNLDIIHIENEGSLLIAASPVLIENLKQLAITGKGHSASVMTGRFQNKIVVITGGAKGFGAGIADELFHEGANIVLADLDEDESLMLVDFLNSKGQANKADFFKTNVANASEVQHMVQHTVSLFGGVDILISNAGILKAGGVKDLSVEDFEMITDLNYTSFFNCVKYVSKIMRLQTMSRPGYFCDIIQINSKSGLQGSKLYFAYAGSKFGGIGLTQSFALELIADRIKVNSICPGNFFDGTLWTDPVNGLFVQFLKSGKVPGAKSIDDVRKHFEKQIPAGRGCKVKDVVRALFYAIEQEYETGQAIPVTGGQVMLH